MAAITDALSWIIPQVWRDRRLRSRYGEFRDKVVLVTGASSGIGREIAAQFFSQGAKVILASRSEGRLLEVKDELMKLETDVPVHVPAVLTLDLEQVDSMEAKSREAEEVWGRVDILVNCGGISVRGGAVQTNLDVHRKIMNINYFGAMELTRNIVQSMCSRGAGVVVNISSLQGRIAIPDRAAYAASKHALQAFSDSLRAELTGSGVTVLVVSPGYVRTELSKNSLTAGGEKYDKLDSTTENGYSVQYIAEQVLHSVLAGDQEVVLAPLHHRLAILLRALLPSLYFYLMARRARKNK